MGDTTSDKVIVVTGDSHARAWIPAFEQIAQEAGYAAYYLVKQQCTAAFVDPGQLGTGDPWPECEEFHEWVPQQVETLHPDLMVVATSPPPTGVYDDEGRLLTDSARTSPPTWPAASTTCSPPTCRYVDRMVLLADVPRLPEEPGRVPGPARRRPLRLRLRPHQLERGEPADLRGRRGARRRAGRRPDAVAVRRAAVPGRHRLDDRLPRPRPHQRDPGRRAVGAARRRARPARHRRRPTSGTTVRDPSAHRASTEPGRTPSGLAA